MTYGKNFFACFNHRLTPLQKQEVQNGLDAGLSPEQVETYASSAYNWLQMREIRLALEHAPDVKKNASLYEPSMDIEKMQKLRRRIEKGERIRTFSMARVMVTVAFLLLMIGAVSLSFATGKNMQPYLHLTREETTIPQGGRFEPMDYVAEYSASKGELILPSDLNTSSPGIIAAVYVLRTPQTEITRILNVEVIAREQ